MRFTLLLFFFLIISNGYAQNRHPKPALKDSLSSDVFLDLVEQTLNDYYQQADTISAYATILDDLEMEATDNISDNEICKRLKAINEISAFKLTCNSTTLAAIRTFIRTRKPFVQITMGRSDIYFGMYNELLDKYNLPPILKYLSVIESALNPKIRSRAGALGLWQFMYGTGVINGLQSNSYIDERMDPYKSTEAACRYLKKLHDIYDDWNLALAAYNGGPGTVNRAIRRAGGKMDYWQIRRFLPGETQQYVPRFIAATYLFIYANQHHIKKAPVLYNYYQLDTMCLKKGVQMKEIANLVNWSVDSIQFFNPVFKSTYIPKTNPPQCITGPLQYIGKIVSKEEQLYQKSTTEQDNNPVVDSVSNPDELYPLKTETVFENYQVKKGEDVMDIASQFNTSPTLIKETNNLVNGTLKEGTVIKIPKKVVSSTQVNGTPTEFEVDTIYYDTTENIIHIVERNENLSTIAKKYNVSKDSIMLWNQLKNDWINIGQKLKVNAKIKRYHLVKKAQESVKKPETPVKPTVSHQYYTIRQGDLFGRIASRYGLSVSQLKRLNPHVNADRIRAGQRLRVR